MATVAEDITSITQVESGMMVSRLVARTLCAFTLVLIFMGALVKSHEAGLSVPDWPTTYGYNMFMFPPSEWRANVFYEHTHRLVASLVGIITLFLFCWVALHDRRNSIRWFAFAALAVVALQGVLGGLTVLYLLPAYLSVAHGVLAQSYLLLIVFLARIFSANVAPQWGSVFKPDTERTAHWAIGLTVVVWIQLLLGAIVRHTESGLAIPDFPAMGGQWLPMFDDAMLSRINEWRLDQTLSSNAFLPDVSMEQVAIHAIHRFWALVVLAAYAGLLRKIWKCRPSNLKFKKAALGIGILIAIQIALGAFTITTQRLPLVASLHVLTGAVLLAASWYYALEAIQLPSYFGHEKSRAVLTE
ncbi:MAG: heme A synthase [Candidatus Hydrogenedentes bacterium]|nr:heme A synthase [Candidatus Hydrogenedentota bacterium]